MQKNGIVEKGASQSIEALGLRKVTTRSIQAVSHLAYRTSELEVTRCSDFMEFANGVGVYTAALVLRLLDASTTSRCLAQLCSFAEEHRFTMRHASCIPSRGQRPADNRTTSLHCTMHTGLSGRECSQSDWLRHIRSRDLGIMARPRRSCISILRPNISLKSGISQTVQSRFVKELQ